MAKSKTKTKSKKGDGDKPKKTKSKTSKKSKSKNKGVDSDGGGGDKPEKVKRGKSKSGDDENANDDDVTTEKSKSKTKSKKDKKSKDKGKRPPPVAMKAPRGVSLSMDVISHDLSKEEQLRKFGPCTITAHQAKTAILMLPSPEVHVVIESLNCLQKFCKRLDENRKLFIEMDGLIEARKLIFSENQVIQRFAMKLIAVTSSYHQAAVQLRDMEVAKDFVALAALEDDVVVEYSTFALSSLAMLYTGRLQIVQNAGVPILIHLLSHPDPDIQKNSAETIWRLMEEPLNVDLITTKGSVEPIVNLVDSEYPALQIVALSILEKVSSRDPGVQVMEGIEAMNPLGEKLAFPDYGDLHRSILRTLTNMCMNQSARLKIVPFSPIAARVLDTSPDPQAQVLALGLMGILSTVPQVAAGFVEYGMCKRLIKILTGDDDLDMKEVAAYVISQLAQTDFRAKQELVDALAPLLELSETNKLSGAGFEYTMMAIASILEDSSKACPTFVNIGGICVLRRILENREQYTQDGILSLLACIALITGHCNLRDHCVDANIISVLLSVVQATKTSQFLTSTANALVGLLCVEGGRKQFLENGGYDFLVELISHIEFPVVTASVPIIHVLATFQDVTKGLIEQGILQVFWKRQDLISKNGPLRTAFEHLISSYQPVKYAISGHIDPYEKLTDGFYDIGGLKSNECFRTINQMTWENKDPLRQVLYLNWTGNVTEEVALQENKSLQVMKSENQSCQSLLDVVKQEVGTIKSEKELVRSIAIAVSDRMGGILDKWRVSSYSEDLEVADMQMKHESVVVPISMISTGGFRTRALLFKAMCDVFGIPCSIERGEYNRMWNVVLLQSKRPQKPLCPCLEDVEDISKSLVYTEKLRRFVVDLVYQPGALLPVNSYDANTYCFI